MGLLSIEQRKKIFHKLGYGSYNTTSIKKLQKKYFVREKDIDGVYGRDTDTLLRHVYNVWSTCSHFRPEEFKCHCGGRYCTGYPDRMKAVTLKAAEAIRAAYGKPMTITSGLRCRKWNQKQSGSAAQSKHVTGRAIDWYIKGAADTYAHKLRAMGIVQRVVNRHEYSYCNGLNSQGQKVNAPYMGEAIHTQVK